MIDFFNISYLYNLKSNKQMMNFNNTITSGEFVQDTRNEDTTFETGTFDNYFSMQEISLLSELEMERNSHADLQIKYNKKDMENRILHRKIKIIMEINNDFKNALKNIEKISMELNEKIIAASEITTVTTSVTDIAGSVKEPMKNPLNYDTPRVVKSEPQFPQAPLKLERSVRVDDPYSNMFESVPLQRQTCDRLPLEHDNCDTAPIPRETCDWWRDLNSRFYDEEKEFHNCDYGPIRPIRPLNRDTNRFSDNDEDYFKIMMDYHNFNYDDNKKNDFE